MSLERGFTLKQSRWSGWDLDQGREGTKMYFCETKPNCGERYLIYAEVCRGLGVADIRNAARQNLRNKANFGEP